MKHLYFMRHGLSEGNKANVWSGAHNTPLSQEGHKQAEAAALLAKKEGIRFDAIISSNLDRAHHTALHIARGVGFPEEDIVLHEGFIERGFGVIEGLQAPEITERYASDESVLDEVEGAEKIADLDARARQMLEYLQTLPFDTILVVSHGNFGRALRRAINKDASYTRGDRFEHAVIVKLI